MAYLKSVLWLLGTGAVGYTLLLVTAPDDKVIEEKYPETRTPEAIKKKKEIVEALRLAAESKNPLYRQSKEEIESILHGKKQ